jgi:hypothetical protein
MNFSLKARLDAPGGTQEESHAWCCWRAPVGIGSIVLTLLLEINGESLVERTGHRKDRQWWRLTVVDYGHGDVVYPLEACTEAYAKPQLFLAGS